MRLLHWFGEAERFLDLKVASVEARRLLGPHSLDYLDSLLELVDALGVGRIWIPVGLIFLAQPSGADPQFETSTADVIQSRGDLGQQGRVAKRIGADHLGHYDTLGYRRNRAQRRVAFEQRLVGQLHISAVNKQVIAESHAMVTEQVSSFG